MFHINIGLATNDGQLLDPRTVLDALVETVTRPDYYTVIQSDTEPTFVAEWDSLPKAKNPTPTTLRDALALLADSLGQDCLAVAVTHTTLKGGFSGELLGPRADKWAPFNPRAFITTDGTRLYTR